MKIKISLRGAQYESVVFVAEGATEASVRDELESLVQDIQAVGWDAYEALAALRDGRQSSEPAASNPLPTAEELIKSELGGRVVSETANVVDSVTKPFWERESAPAAVPATVTQTVVADLFA